MDKELLIKNITHYCVLRKMYPTRACEAAGVGKSFISDIRRGKVPSVEKVQQLADYLGISTSELLGEEPTTKEPADPKAGEQNELDVQLMRLLSQADPDLKRTMLALLEQHQKHE
jgi:transcriptional regulator with XRE-family HTH domain